MGKIRRFGRDISNVHLDPRILDEMNWDKYLSKLRQFVRAKKVFIVKIKFWSEEYLFNWLLENYQKLGFDRVEPERSPNYLKLKKLLVFEGYPDFLVLKDNKWMRLEVECFTSDYHHGPNYADIIFCYNVTSTKNIPENVEIISLKNIFKQRKSSTYLKFHIFSIFMTMNLGKITIIACGTVS